MRATPAAAGFGRNALVAKLASREQEAALADAQGVGDRDGVEVLDAEVGDRVAALLHIQAHLVQVPELALHHEEEHVLAPVRGRRHDEQPALVGHVRPPRNGRADRLVVLRGNGGARLASGTPTCSTAAPPRQPGCSTRPTMFLYKIQLSQQMRTPPGPSVSPGTEMSMFAPRSTSSLHLRVTWLMPRSSS